jgi:hypothetical protein
MPLKLPDQRAISRQLKDMGYVPYTIGTKKQGPKIGGKEHCIYYRPDRVSPSDFEPLLKQFFDRTNRLSQSGELLAEMILPTIEDYYFSVLSDE